jgi:CRISPR system Cascade subunit CasE
MYLSRLIIDGMNRNGRITLSNPYKMHQFVLSGFPDFKDQIEERVLYRLEPEQRNSHSVILVQSLSAPNWNDNSMNGLRNVQTKQFSPKLTEGQLVRFRLRANPTVKKEGKRFGLLKEEEALSWLRRKAEAAGFSLAESSPIIVSEGAIKAKRGKSRQLTFQSYLFQGVINVRDPERLLSTLPKGIGSAKAFGFGLLSLSAV